MDVISNTYSMDISKLFLYYSLNYLAFHKRGVNKRIVKVTKKQNMLEKFLKTKKIDSTLLEIIKR